MSLHCGYCGSYNMHHEMAEGNCCIRCYNKRNRETKKEEKGMEKKVYVFNFADKNLVSEEDYVKVVKENKRYEKLITLNEDKLLKELKEKDELIKQMKYQTDRLANLTHFVSQNYKGYAGWDTVEAVKDILGENDQETWTLKYIYSVDSVVKEFEQNGMIKEDAEELIGMDSDNWTHYSLTKEKRPNKDQVIEGLLIRCESNEELIKELEEKNDEMKNRISYLENFNKGNKSKDCM